MFTHLRYIIALVYLPVNLFLGTFLSKVRIFNYIEFIFDSNVTCSRVTNLIG